MLNPASACCGFHFTLKHGSWLNQVELWFGVLARRFLARGNFCSAEDFESRFREFLDDYNLNWAHPYRWTYTGQPLVRDTPFSKRDDNTNGAGPVSAPDPKPTNDSCTRRGLTGQELKKGTSNLSRTVCPTHTLYVQLIRHVQVNTTFRVAEVPSSSG